MSKGLYLLIALAAVCGGAYYYIHSHNIDLKALFGADCDCHGGSCGIKHNSSSSSPVKSVLTPSTQVAPESMPRAEHVATPMPTANSTAVPSNLAPIQAHTAPSQEPITKPITTAATPATVKPATVKK